MFRPGGAVPVWDKHLDTAEDGQGAPRQRPRLGAIEVLKTQAARQLVEQRDWDEAWVDSGLVFTAQNGAALDPESVSRYCARR
jgi:hypothetical protein